MEEESVEHQKENEKKNKKKMNKWENPSEKKRKWKKPPIEWEWKNNGTNPTCISWGRKSP
jgi:hypothetical protein